MESVLPSIVFPIDSTPFGEGYAYWTVKWWRWLLSIPKERNPALDTTGEFCSIFQYDRNVWFLAGTFGGIAHRRCTVPSGRAIFMPAINYECSFAGSRTLTEGSELEAKCKAEIDDIRDVTFELNEDFLTDVSAYRVRSPLFAVRLIKDNVLGADPGITYMATDGFWIFLKPLEPGTYQISSFASCRSGKIKIGASYQLLIE